MNTLPVLEHPSPQVCHLYLSNKFACFSRIKERGYLIFISWYVVSPKICIPLLIFTNGDKFWFRAPKTLLQIMRMNVCRYHITKNKYFANSLFNSLRTTLFLITMRTVKGGGEFDSTTSLILLIWLRGEKIAYCWMVCLKLIKISGLPN